jgi:cell division protein ZapA
MGELSIKIRIADRDYPMRVSADDQDKVRLAGKQLNEKLKSFRQQFGVDSNQDLLAMVAFDSEVEKVNASEQEGNSAVDALLLAKITELDNLVSNALLD